MSVVGVDLGDVVLDFVRLEVFWRGRTHVVPHRQMVILYHLALAGGPVEGPALARKVFGSGNDETRRRLSLAVSYLNERVPGIVRTLRRRRMCGEYVLVRDQEEGSAA